ncbi:MAG: aminoglycoside phosphotransferase family protein [Phycisphaerales bacterium]
MSAGRTPSPTFGAGLLLGASSHDLGTALEPQLKEICATSHKGERLDDVRWFRTDWQRGGAATAYAKHISDQHGVRDVVVKLPVGPREYRFLTSLNDTDAPTPRVLFHGMELGGYDLAWVVMERLPGNPVAAALNKGVFQQLAESAAKVHLHAGQRFQLTEAENQFNWEFLMNKAKEAVKLNHPKEEADWSALIKHTQRALPSLVEHWNHRPINTWCHGDLHPGNAMLRPEGSAWGPPGMVLLDFAEAHPGHWVEDAVYLERQFWGRPEITDGAKPVSLLAKARKALGLDCSDDYAGFANVRRLLMASAAPAFMHREGGAKYLHAAREIAERLLIMLGK